MSAYLLALKSISIIFGQQTPQMGFEFDSVSSLLEHHLLVKATRLAAPSGISSVKP